LALPIALLTIALSERAAAQDTSAVRATPGGILVDFQDVDLRAVITALGEAGSLNVTYGDIPSRRVTLRLHSPVAKSDILPLLRSLAQSNGLQVIQEDKLIRLQADNAASAAARTDAQGGQGPRRAENRLYVYSLKHVRAAKLASTLQAIFGGRSGATPVASDAASPRTLSQQLTSNQVPPQASLGDTSRGRAPGVVVAGADGIAGTLQGEVKIVPDETTNSLVVHAQPADYAIVKQAIEALDLRPLQVLIEVLIAEVRHTTKFEPPNVTPDAPARFLSKSATEMILRLSQQARFDVNLAMNALQTTGDVRILSRPVLLAQNNQEAKILVGSQRPFVQVFRSLPTDAAVRDQVVQYKDVGTSLTILPTINSDGYVNLQVGQEVSTATNEVQFGAPVISTRETSTHLFIRDGKTAVLGGLIDREQEQTHVGLPFLSALPIVGVFFGSTTDSRTTSELFLFLTPHIMQTDDDAEHLREQMEARSPSVQIQLPKNQPLPPVKPPAGPP
jgi:general secretion pathway protein D